MGLISSHQSFISLFIGREVGRVQVFENFVGRELVQVGSVNIFNVTYIFPFKFENKNVILVIKGTREFNPYGNPALINSPKFVTGVNVSMSGSVSG